MSTFSEQLKKARTAAGYTVREAIEAFHQQSIDISEKTLYGWERGIRTPDADVFLRLCRIYQIESLSDFMEGNQKPVTTEIERKYASLDDHGRRLVSLVLEEEYERVHPVVKLNPRAKSAERKTPEKRKMAELWVSEQSAAAGTGTILDGDSFIKQSVPADLLVSGTSFGVPVSGDSMEPRYFDGDILLVSKQQMPSVGEIGVFLLDGKGYVKQRGTKELISLNTKYEPIPMDNDTRCFGKVIGVIRSDELM
ncbi:MAG: helix-turn-helix domain-containing protein [Clostridia bacterium]|nr:helix-turn-helix domain-containing protein [Clostridia bacterium]